MFHLLIDKVDVPSSHLRTRAKLISPATDSYGSNLRSMTSLPAPRSHFYSNSCVSLFHETRKLDEPSTPSEKSFELVVPAIR